MRPKDNSYRRAFEEWCRYHFLTEKHDLRVCSKVDEKGVAQPSTREEYRLVNAYARKLREEVRENLRGLPSDLISQAERNASRLSQEDLAMLVRPPHADPDVFWSAVYWGKKQG